MPNLVTVSNRYYIVTVRIRLGTGLVVRNRRKDRNQVTRKIETSQLQAQRINTRRQRRQLQKWQHHHHRQSARILRSAVVINRVPLRKDQWRRELVRPRTQLLSRRKMSMIHNKPMKVGENSEL